MFITIILPVFIALVFLSAALIFDGIKKDRTPKQHGMKLARRRFFRIAGAAVSYLGLVQTCIYGIFGLPNAIILFVGLYLFFVPELKLLAYKIFPNAAKPVMRAVWTFFFIGLTTALTLFGFLLSGQFNTPTGTEGTVVVLGAQVKGDVPSLSLATRINAAYDYLSAHPQTVCIATGGRAKGENITEAQCIRDELVKKGIDPERIICENEAVDTDTNMEYSAKIIEDLGLDKNIVIVTESYHQFRSSLYAKRYGLVPTSYSSHSPFALQSASWVREMLGLVKFAAQK